MLLDWQAAKTRLLQPLLHHARLGVICDVDGTLSPIVEHPDAAVLTPRNRALLRDLQAVAVLVAAVSGRSAADLHERVGVEGVVYVGNHGLERWQDGEVQVMPAVAPYQAALRRFREQLRLEEGMLLEDKGATLSIHYRQTPDPAATAARYRPLLQQMAAAHDLKLTEGRMVFELRPPLEVHKGTALAFLVQNYQLDAALFLGDDTTDADAMRVARDLRLAGECYAVAGGVLSADTPPAVRENADVLVQGVQGVETLLSWLFQARSASST